MRQPTNLCMYVCMCILQAACLRLFMAIQLNVVQWHGIVLLSTNYNNNNNSNTCVKNYNNNNSNRNTLKLFCNLNLFIAFSLHYPSHTFTYLYLRLFVTFLCCHSPLLHWPFLLPYFNSLQSAAACMLLLFWQIRLRQLPIDDRRLRQCERSTAATTITIKY